MALDDFAASIIIFIVTLFLVLVLTYLFRKRSVFSKEKIVQQLIIFSLLITGLIFIIFTLPIGVEDKNIILTLVGIIIGAVITFASTTFVANAMAGIMLRLINPFLIGDFIQINDTFGRVTEINFLHTQVQSIDRDLVTIPNSTLVLNPLKTIRSSGTIITTSVSLGYNIPRKSIERNLLLAAERIGLENPFVHVMNLGDFSVTYKVGGLLKDVESVITARSDFRKSVMDSLHEADIEIVSPTFTNRRELSNDYVCLPPEEEDTAVEIEEQKIPDVKTEEIIFDKAIEARHIDYIYKTVEMFPERRKALEERLKKLPDEDSRESIRAELKLLEQKEVELKPAVQELMSIPDITAAMDEKEKQLIIDSIRNIESMASEIDIWLKRLEKRLENFSD
ncbi:mechanosensitive ion channel domain-containing protein [Methanolobus halotolerans]|uniref:Transport channel protein n=1 Tax=Methanolobus halotolerans TaxID=2052935 RepID=A0A4E0QZJ2_9EURY|nr:mechanosensitive ion channel domain-containing protein [Methanolobus halotolerans]TGC09184.1 transport channel protein [Methanolobus halotolerans]